LTADNADNADKREKRSQLPLRSGGLGRPATIESGEGAIRQEPAEPIVNNMDLTHGLDPIDSGFFVTPAGCRTLAGGDNPRKQHPSPPS
jgi:hypothetical protein